MRRVQIKEISSVVSKGTTPTTHGHSYQEAGIPLLRVNNIDSGKFNLEDVKYIDEKAHDDLKRSQLQKNDLIISIAGSIGKTAIVEESILPANCNQALAFVRLDDEKIDLRFVQYWLNSQDAIGQITKNKVTATISNLSLTQIKNLKIPLPSLSEQKAIVAKLDRAQRLIDIDKEMLAKYDELIQSVFLEMFGDVFSDKIKTPFEDHLDIKHGYAFKSKWFDDEGDVPVVKIGTVNKSTVDFSEIQYLDKSYAEEYERFKVYPGDLLLSMTGTVGKDDYANPCVMTDEYDFYLLNQRVVKLNYDQKVFTKSFLYHFFKQDHIKRELTKFSRGIRQANLSNKDIYGLSFQKPNFDKQLQFEALCDKIEKEKRSLKESTKKSEELFSSLVQGAFG